MNKPQMMKIINITNENSSVKTFFFEHDLKSQPGQFVMLWIPGVDQKPFSIVYDDGKQFGLSIFAVGPLSKKLFELNVGDRVGITGPFGKGFSVKPNTHYIMVGGGYGAGPLGLLAERLTATDSTVDFCVGARTKDLLLFEERIAKLPYTTVRTATNDGSSGHTGFITDILEECLNTPHHRPVLVVTCGPELMEKKVLDICNEHGVDAEISIERYMKCGFNICGQCCVDGTGMALCSQGPVVSSKLANQITEFGKYHRDKSGKKINY